MKDRAVIAVRVGPGVRNATFAWATVRRHPHGSSYEIAHVDFTGATELKDGGDYGRLRDLIDESMRYAPTGAELVLDISCGTAFADMYPDAAAYLVANGSVPPQKSDDYRITRIGRETIFSALKEGFSRKAGDGRPFIRIDGLAEEEGIKDRFKTALQKVALKPPKPDVDGLIDVDTGIEDNLVSIVALAAWHCRNESSPYDWGMSDRVLQDAYVRLNLSII